MKKKTIGIIGPGEHFNKRIYPVINKSNFFKIAGVLRNKKNKFYNIKVYNFNEFFKKKFDFIYISTVNKKHERYIIKSLKTSSHVLCEKPFITNYKNIKKIINFSISKKKLIFENFSYSCHPVFEKLKKLIQDPKFGKIKYAISNFKYPSKNIKNQRYLRNQGDGFFYDAAVYAISLENYLFNKYQEKKGKYLSDKIKKKVDLRGFILINSKNFKRFYFWGEGQNYSNNLEIIFENSSLFIDKIFSKNKKDNISIKIFFKNKTRTINIKKADQFEIALKKIQINYFRKSFQDFHRQKIIKQIELMKKFSKVKKF